MELKIWVEGIQRIVCGVTEATTCQDVVFALAHATGKTGRFTLIEKWRNNERLLAPQETPLKILMKWGEYSSDVQFILQRSDQKLVQPPQQSSSQATTTTTTSSSATTTAHAIPATNNVGQQQHILRQQQNKEQSSAAQIIKLNSKYNNINTLNATQRDLMTTNNNNNSSDKNKENRKNLYLSSSDNKIAENVGIVKGVQQQKPSNIVSPQKPTNNIFNSTLNSSNSTLSSNSSMTNVELHNNNNNSSSGSINNNDLNISTTSSPSSNKQDEFNTADVRNSLDRKIKYNNNNSNNNHMIIHTNNLSNENLLEIFNNNKNYQPHQPETVHGISTSGALIPPPYRDPPPPINSSPLNITNNLQLMQKIDNNKSVNNNLLNMNLIFNNINDINDLNDVLLNNTAQYRDLIQLIKYQRDKINVQQADLTKFDAEIVYLENKGRDQMQQYEVIQQELNKTDLIYRQGNEQLQTFQYVEEENELVRQQEKTLKSELTLLRSKLANCETELLQCKNKIRLIMDEIQVEQRQYNRQYDNRQLERHLMSEVERIETEIELAIQNTDMTTSTSDSLKNEVSIIEQAIAEKKKQVEQLVHEMKEVNLQSLAVAPADEVRYLLEGCMKPGSTRRMIGSPRQLENAVPTSKNPHGVWV